MNRFGTFLVATLLASCSPVPDSAPATRAATVSALPAMRGFSDNTVVPVTRSNSEMAEDFLDLVFRMENGRAIAGMSRFEGPITVRIAPGAPATLAPDLDALLARLRREAQIDISRTDRPDAGITVEAVPQKVLQRAVPQAACFVVPRVRNWAEFLSMRKTDAVDWTTLKVRTHATIFIPADAAPQEIRDCLHEELAQALGPLNDLYRLPDSVFNDDNIHAVLTGFDMLMLRATYAPELRNGIGRVQAAGIIGPLLAHLNPRGERGGQGSFPDTSRDWITAMETALTNGSSPGARRQSIDRAVRIAQQFGWGGPREGFSYYALGRLQVGHDSTAALAAFGRADAIYSASPLMQIHSAHIAVQKAAFTLSAGDAIGTIDLADKAIPVAARHQNAALMATLMMFKAEALDMQGDSVAAEAVRVDSLGWARYGFGSDANVRDRLAEISGLRPY
ncbi:DUF2927 domain-containing protein [Loktanella sp. DJP18]|uniref:DUF2927 domain-containing protein n=1 Tax=Loktanella sp. DJP18 TaxID=3409788 RepID=UPI003BB5EA64